MSKLYYVIGASGAGKDSLLHYARQKMPDDTPVIFAHRYITRAADAGGENHIALSTQEFLRRQKQLCFAMHWFSHETHYGIGKEINLWLLHGLDVVINGSREYLQQASKKYPNLVPVLISVNPDVLYERLIKRGRETDEQIKNRLVQAVKLEKEVSHANLIRIENNNLMQHAGDDLLNAILSQVKDKCA